MTTNQQMISDLPVTIIKPSHGWVSLKLDELWEYRELLSRAALPTF